MNHLGMILAASDQKTLIPGAFTFISASFSEHPTKNRRFREHLLSFGTDFDRVRRISTNFDAFLKKTCFLKTEFFKNLLRYGVFVNKKRPKCVGFEVEIRSMDGFG